MQLSKEITRQYLSRMLLFKNVQEISEMMGVKRTTVARWVDGQGTPRESLLPDIERAFDLLLDWIEGQGFEKVAEVLDFERPEIQGAIRMKPSRVEGWLYQRLHDKKSRRRTYDLILKDAMKTGITRSQLYRASLKLGVYKELRGMGINRESVWSLP